MNAEIQKLADRHLLPDPQGVLLRDHVSKSGSVVISIQDELARSLAGQHLAWMLVNLVCRQFDVVKAIYLHAPQVRLFDRVAAFGNKDNFPDTLVECVTLVAGEHIRAIPFTDPNTIPTTDVEFVIGWKGINTNASQRWFLYADGWRWQISRLPTFPEQVPYSDVSFGSYMAACFGAGEVFKFLLGMKPGKGSHIESLAGSAWTMTNHSDWSKLTDGPTSSDIPGLPHVYFAGAGAVAQAAALALGSSRIAGSGTVIDNDVLDLTNGNRYVLSHKAQAGDAKVKLLSDYFAGSKFKCDPHNCWWNEYTLLAGRTSKFDEQKILEKNYRYPTVLSCVDKNGPRHSIQNILPRIIIGASTDGLTSKVSVFDLNQDKACLKCFNPLPDSAGIAAERIAALKKADTTARNTFCEDTGLSKETLEKILSGPQCGQLSEEDLERFSKSRPEMSVGFASAAAGTMMAVQLIRTTILGTEAVTHSGQTYIAAYSHPGIKPFVTLPDAMCLDHASGRSNWRALWAK